MSTSLPAQATLTEAAVRGPGAGFWTRNSDSIPPPLDLMFHNDIFPLSHTHTHTFQGCVCAVKCIDVGRGSNGAVAVFHDGDDQADQLREAARTRVSRGWTEGSSTSVDRGKWDHAQATGQSNHCRRG